MCSRLCTHDDIQCTLSQNETPSGLSPEGVLLIQIREKSKSVSQMTVAAASLVAGLRRGYCQRRPAAGHQ